MATTLRNYTFTLVQNKELHLYIHNIHESPAYCILSDVIWDQFIGQWQKEIKYSPTEYEIHVHLEKCRWVDPLPALSVLIEISVILEKFSNVCIYLQEFNEEKILSSVKNLKNKFGRDFLRKYKFLKFLADQNIIDKWLDKGATVLLGSKKMSSTTHNISNNIIDITSRFLRSYSNSDLVPIQIIQVPHIDNDDEFPGKYADQLLNEIETQLNTDLPISSTDKVLYKLKLILQECIHNVQEHAYDINEPKYVGIYIRYRTGGESISDLANKNIFKINIKEESKRSPKLDNEWINCREGAIEFFVIDRGKGIINSFQKVNMPSLTLQKIVLDTFESGLSSKSDRFSAKGGLHLINSVSTGDYLRVFCGDTWIGTPFPVVRATAQIHEKHQTKVVFKGFALHFRLGWKNLTDKGSSWFNIGGTAESHKNSLNKILSENYKDIKQIIEPFSYAIIDERFENITQEEVFETTKKIKNNGVLIWLVRPGRMKWDIFTFLERYIQKGIIGKNIKLIISDIGSHEASTYEATFSGANLEKRNSAVTWPFDISEIILVSQRWLFAKLSRCFLDREKNRIITGSDRKDVTSVQYSAINNEDIILVGQEGSLNNITIRKLTIYLCKLHDSNLFWSYVDQQVNQNLYINKTIKWNSDIPTMNGYLNFSNAVRVPAIYKLLKLSLSKYISAITLATSDIGAIISLDRLVFTLVEDIKSSKPLHGQHLVESNRSYSDLSVGSVYVSGITKSFSQPTLDTIHFFMHPDTVLNEGSINHLFYWLKNNEDCQSEEKFERVGRTSAIAPNGWKSLEIPRYSDGVIVGQRTPTETYNDIQSLRPIISKTGHWHYEGQHDFLTFNLKDAIEDAFAKSQTNDNNLFLFLVSTFFGYLSIDIDNCIKKEYVKVVLKALSDQNIKSFKNKGIIVYRSHLVSELIVSKLLELVSPAAKADVLSKIFPIIPLRRRWNGSAFIISPMDSQTMKDSLQKLPLNERNVLIFDDAVITGRTLLDITSTMLAVGAMDVDVAVIMNRMRSPSLKSLSGQMQYYWRVDVPPIGREGSCPLCHAIEILKVFKNKLCVNDYLQVVSNWADFWRKATPISEWHKGLKPLPLNNTNYKKNYCFDQKDFKHKDRIHITRTNGLITHVSELHSMTGADDYVVDRINKMEANIDESIETKVELISSQLLLFCSEYDYKETLVLLKKLIVYLNYLDKSSPYTGLAFIALISGIEVVNRNSKVEFVKKLISETANNDSEDTETLTLFKAFLISHELLDGKDFIRAEQLLKSDGLEFSLLIREVHASILSPSGNKHSRPLTRFIDRLETDVTDEFKTYLSATLWIVKNHLTRLLYILETIGLNNARYLINENAQDAYLNTKNTIKVCIGKLDEEVNDNNRLIISKCCSEVILDMAEYLKFYAQHIPLSQPNPFVNIKKSMALLLERIKDRGIQSKIKLISGGSNAIFNPTITSSCWVIWTADIEQIIEDLICNSGHIKLLSTSDEDDNFEGEENHMWIKLTLENTGLKISIKNRITSHFTVDNIFGQLSAKRRWSSIENYGGAVELLKSEHPQDMKIGITIPFIHKLTGSLKG